MKKRKALGATEKFFVHEEYLSPIWNDINFEYTEMTSSSNSLIKALHNEHFWLGDDILVTPEEAFN